MAEEKKNLSADVADVEPAAAKEVKKDKKAKKVEKKPNAFVRLWNKICKLCKDVFGEMKKVTWTSKEDLSKGTKLVVAAVVAIGASIAVVDTLFSWIINSIAALIG